MKYFINSNVNCKSRRLYNYVNSESNDDIKYYVKGASTKNESSTLLDDNTYFQSR